MAEGQCASGWTGSEASTDLMKNLPTEKDVPTVDDNPVWNPKREQHMHDPVGVDPFKGLGEVRQ